MQVGRKFPHRAAGLFPDVHVDPALADAQRRLDRLDHPRALGGGEPQPVLHHFELVLVARVYARVALLLEQLLDLGRGEILRHRHREGDDQARIAGGFRALGEQRMDAVRRVARHLRAAAAAEQLSGAGEQQLEMVVQLGHRADRRARGTHRIGLIDRDRRRNAGDRIDLRLVHAVEKLPRVGTESLDVAALALGVERVEDQRRFPRARDAGDDDQLVERDLEREVLEVVLARAADDDGAVF